MSEKIVIKAKPKKEVVAFQHGSYFMYSNVFDNKAIPLIRTLCANMGKIQPLNEWDTPARKVYVWFQDQIPIEEPRTKTEMRMRLNLLLGQTPSPKFEDIFPEAIVLKGTLEHELAEIHATLRQQWKMLRLMDIICLNRKTGVNISEYLEDPAVDDYMREKGVDVEDTLEPMKIETIQPVIVMFFSDIKVISEMFQALGYLERFSERSEKFKVTFVMVINHQECYDDFRATIRAGIKTAILTDPIKQSLCDALILPIGVHRGKAWRVNKEIEKKGYFIGPTH